MYQQYIEVADEQTVYLALSLVALQVRLYAFRGIMYMDLSSGDDYIFAGKRVIQNTWLLPSFMTEQYGNIRFESYKADGDDYVWWDGFNEKFRLMVYTPDEVKAMEKQETE